MATLNGEPSTPLEVSPQEMTHIKKYRTLDRYGKEAVDAVLDVECRRYAEYKAALAAKEEEEESHVIELTSIEPIAEIEFKNTGFTAFFRKLILIL